MDLDGGSIFRNRADAGERLAKELTEYRGTNALVLAIPRGGVEIGAIVAREIDGELALAIVRKLGHPAQPELAFGAVAEDGSTYLSPYISGEIPREQIHHVLEREEREIRRRVRAYRDGRPLPPMKNRTVIIVDDGVATGATVFATIKMCRAMKAKRVVLALPVAPHTTARELHALVDDFIVLELPHDLYAVGQAYDDFHSVSDEEVLRLLAADAARKHNSPKGAHSHA